MEQQLPRFAESIRNDDYSGFSESLRLLGPNVLIEDAFDPSPSVIQVHKKFTPLQLAVKAENLQFVREILAHPDVDPNLVDQPEYDDLPLHIAYEKENPRLVYMIAMHPATRVSRKHDGHRWETTVYIGNALFHGRRYTHVVCALFLARPEVDLPSRQEISRLCHDKDLLSIMFNIRNRKESFRLYLISRIGKAVLELDEHKTFISKEEEESGEHEVYHRPQVCDGAFLYAVDKYEDFGEEMQEDAAAVPVKAPSYQELFGL